MRHATTTTSGTTTIGEETDFSSEYLLSDISAAASIATATTATSSDRGGADSRSIYSYPSSVLRSSEADGLGDHANNSAVTEEKSACSLSLVRFVALVNRLDSSSSAWIILKV